MNAWLSILVLLLPSLLMLFAVGTERLETTRLGAGTVREEDVKVFLDRVQRVQLTRGSHVAGTRHYAVTATPTKINRPIGGAMTDTHDRNNAT